jgi:hypothetical protein
MKGFYVYCIRPQVANTLPTKAKGVEFAKSIKALPFKDIEAIVGEIDPSKFNGEKIKNKLLDDQKWAEENIRAHHEVIDWAFQTSVVIPMKFGTMYKSKKSLDEMLAKYYRRFTNLISRLQDRKEWGVKAYLDHKKFIEGLKKKNREIQKLGKRQSSLPEGMRWYTERKIDEIVAGELDEEIEKKLRYFVKKLEKYSEKIQLSGSLSKEMQEPGTETIMNAACLVKNDALQSFRDLFHELAKEVVQKGVLFKLTGPWPPYHFVEIENEAT